MDKTHLQDVFEQWGKCTVLITGITGGVGKVIANILRSSKKINVIGLSSKNQLDNNIIQCNLVSSEPSINENIDYVIHCACTYKRKKDHIMAKNILSFSQKKKVKLFVYFSSWVVHSNTYWVDAYTKLKRDVESLVSQSPLNNYLILRPSIILGGCLIWDRVISYLNYFPRAISKKILINPIHVTDVAEMTLRLMSNKHSYNMAYDLGTSPIPLTQYMEQISHNEPIKKRSQWIGLLIKFLSFPGWKFLSKSASMSFLFNGYAEFNPNKTIKMMPGFLRKKIFLFENVDGALFPNTICQLKTIVQTYPNKVIRGRMGVDILRHEKSNHYISTIKMNRIIKANDKIITVEAGATIKDVCDFLKQQKRMLAHLPEYLLISIGACVVTPVHGSSFDYSGVLDLVTTYQYLDKKTGELHNTSDKTLNHNNHVITQVTLTHEPFYYCEKKIIFKSDAILNSTERFKQEFEGHDSVCVQWYFKKQQIMIWQMDKTPPSPLKSKIKCLQFRHGNLFYYLHKFFQPNHLNNIGYKVLSPITYDFSHPIIRTLIKYNAFIDTEIKIDSNDLQKMISFIKKYKSLMLSCAFRYAKGNFFWVEIIFKKRHLYLLNKLAEFGIFHSGKEIPKDKRLKNAS